MIFTYKDIKELLSGRDDEWLFKTANRIKEQIYGKEVFIRGIIETSNQCFMDCLYCGLRKSSQGINRYSMSEQEITDSALEVSKCGLSSIVLQGGESPQQVPVINKALPIIKELTKADITLSYGEHSDDTYAKWKSLGADRYLLKMETLQRPIYKTIRPNSTLENRLSRLKSLIKHKYQVGSGFLAGLPRYTTEKLAKDLITMKDLGIHMFSISPFIPTSNTPLADETACGKDIIYRACAIYRILDPYVNIPFTNALKVVDPLGIEKGLKRGCNVVMMSFTPKIYREKYSIYPGKGSAKSGLAEGLESLEKQITDIGLMVNKSNSGRSKKQVHYE